VACKAELIINSSDEGRIQVHFEVCLQVVRATCVCVSLVEVQWWRQVHAAVAVREYSVNVTRHRRWPALRNADDD
jgi:hypothetical protein